MIDLQADRRMFLKAGVAACALPGAVSARPSPSARPRYRLSLAAYSLRKHLDLKNPTMTLAEFMQRSADWGFDGVELTEYYFPKPVTSEAALKLKREAIRLGLDITGTPIGNTFTLPPGEEREREIARVRQWIDISAELGSPAIRIFAGRAPRGVDDATARGWAIECIRACLDHAARRGVVLALENHGGVVATAEGMLEFARSIRHDWFGFNLDGGNFHSDDPYAELERCAPYAVTCQVKVEVHRAGRKEPADYGRIFELLRKAGYRGYVTLEYEAAEDPLTAIPKHLEALRKLAG
ncbi:MAG: sugar phosphate isomerase/epimerase family protein [Planctomycetota bacterium]